MIKTPAIIVILLMAGHFMTLAQTFSSQQKQNSRVKAAYTAKESIVKGKLAAAGINDFNIDLYIRVFKAEEILEVWARTKGSGKWSHIIDYSVCSSSGYSGPKRAAGDGQTPEGFYHIDRFNPWSSFHLSLGINYPNSSDRKLCTTGNTGGDIFIHGNCVTIGCVPITDDKIKELYILAVEAKSHGQSKIPVHIFPCKMTEEKIAERLKSFPEHKQFWADLKPAYDLFEQNKTVPVFTIDASGRYKVSK